jgi:ribonuclease HI
LNQDLWGELLEQNAKHTIKWKWVKGHSDNEENNCCDRLAVEARLLLEEQLKKSTP